MSKFFNWLKAKFLCWRDGKNGCASCPHCCDSHDYWGCSFGLRIACKTMRLNLSYKSCDNQYNTNYDANATPYSDNEFHFITF